MKIYDRYGWFKLLMAVMIAIYHYNILVQSVFSIRQSGIIALFIRFSVMLGGSIPMVFFVLSGVAIYKGYYNIIGRDIEDRIGFAEYIRRRIKRLYPLMWVSIIWWSIFDNVYMYNMGEWWTGRDSSLWDVLVAMTGISVGTVFNNIDRVNGPIWYISVLMVCYVVFYILCSIEGLWRKKLQLIHSEYLLFLLPVAVGLAIMNFDINFPFFNSMTAKGYIGFFVGIILIKFIRENALDRNSVGLLIAFLAFMIQIICVIIFHNKLDIFFGNWEMSLCFTFAPPIVIIVERLDYGALFNNRISDFLGQISFPLYLLHMPCFLTISVMKEVIGISIKRSVWNELVYAFIPCILCCIFMNMLNHNKTQR